MSENLDEGFRRWLRAQTGGHVHGILVDCCWRKRVTEMRRNRERNLCVWIALDRFFSRSYEARVVYPTTYEANRIAPTGFLLLTQ